MKRFTAVLTAIIVSVNIYAGVGTTSMDILKVPAGIKAQAMGGAYTAACDNLEALDFNPAGLASIGRLDLMFIHNMYLQDVFYDSAYYAVAFEGAGTLGFMGKFLSAGTVNETTEDAYGKYGGATGRKAGGADFLGGAAYAVNMSRIAFSDFTKHLNVGAALNFSGEMLGGDYSNFGLSADIGAVYTVMIEEEDFLSNRGQPMWNKAGLGIVFKNLGTSFGSSVTPITVAFGAYTQFLNMAFTGSRIRVSADADYDMDNGINLKAGFEYMQNAANYIFAFRAGGNFNPEQRLASGFSLGGGIGIKLNTTTYTLDYVFMPYGDLGSSNKFGLYIQF
jgi:hypothetical protein